MMAAGRWVPKVLRENSAAMARMEAGDFSELDEFNAHSVIRSYKLPGFYSPVGWLAWSKIIRLWEEAQGDPSKLKAVVNTHFGETWVEQGEAPAWESVYARRTGSYLQRQVPKGVVFLTAGADVGQDHVEIAVWGWGRRRQRWLIEHIRIDGLKDDPETWEQVTAAVQRRYLHPTGAVLGLRRFLIDRNYHPEVVDPWVESQDRSVVFALRGSDTLDVPVILVGVMTVSREKGIGFVVIRRTDNDRSADDYLQYVNTDGSASNEFIRQLTGRWSLPQRRQRHDRGAPPAADRELRRDAGHRDRHRAVGLCRQQGGHRDPQLEHRRHLQRFRLHLPAQLGCPGVPGGRLCGDLRQFRLRQELAAGEDLGRPGVDQANHVAAAARPGSRRARILQAALRHVRSKASSKACGKVASAPPVASP